jgi:hypothetical protein
MTRVLALALTLVLAAAALAAQSGPAIAADTAAIDQLGSFDYDVRTAAARAIRRSPPERIVPALLTAVREHRDEYARYRALVLLAGFAEAVTAIAVEPTTQIMRAMLADRNDRLRTVAYQWFEYHPDPAVLPVLIAALDKERSEFLRPALTRAIVAHGDQPSARETVLPLVLRGDDFFRGAVISALGDYRARYALKPLTDVALLDGPLQDDAITALGRIGDASVKGTLATLQRTAGRDVQPTISAAFCLIGIDCDARTTYVFETLQFAATNDGHQPLLRGAVHAAAVLAIGGRDDALRVLVEQGLRSQDPARAAIALGVGTVAVRQPLRLLRFLETQPDVKPAVLLLREAFDMLSEDFDEERFYVAVRRAHWDAPADSPRRRTAAAVIEIAEF